MSMYEGDENNPDAAPPEESSNRTFLIAAGILGGIVLLSIACLAGYALLILPAQRSTQNAVANATRTAESFVNEALTSTSSAASIPTATLPPPTATFVIAQPSATMPVITSTNTPDPATATVGAALTQAAVAQLTIVPTSTKLPGTGIADEYGMPGLVVMAMAFVVVILLARRMRIAPTR